MPKCVKKVQSKKFCFTLLICTYRTVMMFFNNHGYPNRLMYIAISLIKFLIVFVANSNLLMHFSRVITWNFYLYHSSFVPISACGAIGTYLIKWESWSSFHDECRHTNRPCKYGCALLALCFLWYLFHGSQ